MRISVLTFTLILYASLLRAQGGYFPDKIGYSHIPAESVKDLTRRLDSVYKRYDIDLPRLDSTGQLQIRLVSNGKDMIFGLYHLLPAEFGNPDMKEQGRMYWKSVMVPGLPGGVQFDMKYYGVSSYYSKRGSPITTQIVWVSVKSPDGKDLISGPGQLYQNLYHFMKKQVDEIKPFEIPRSMQDKMKK